METFPILCFSYSFLIHLYLLQISPSILPLFSTVSHALPLQPEPCALHVFSLLLSLHLFTFKENIFPFLYIYITLLKGIILEGIQFDPVKTWKKFSIIFVLCLFIKLIKVGEERFRRRRRQIPRSLRTTSSTSCTGRRQVFIFFWYRCKTTPV